MYEDMTFENIMDSMMEDMPDGLDTSEGSLIYHSCVKQAARLEEVYVELAALTDNQYVDTADLDHLVQSGQERRTYIEEATAAEFEGVFNVSVPIGTEFSGDDYNYIVTDVINEEEHKYTDDLGNGYISVTTLIGKYTQEFKKEEIAAACERIGKNPRHPKYQKYKGKTKKQILWEWEQETIKACDKGTKKHNYLETAIKTCNGYKLNANGFINDRIYTIDDIVGSHKYGKLNLEYFVKTGIREKYPDIFSLIAALVTKGYHIYAEIGVYDSQNLVSGLIDILLIRDKEFIILDWKTNKAPIRFESGYYDKKLDGTLDLNNFIYKEEYFGAPLDHLADSIGNHYAMQLSTYANLVESWGYKNVGIILCHIRTIQNQFQDENEEDEEVVEMYDIPYLKNEVEMMIADYSSKHIYKTAKTLF